MTDASPPPLRTTVLWWVVTIATLVVLDDLTYGPIFWLTTAVMGSAAVVVAFVVYLVAQVYLVHHGAKETPGRLARRLLDRLRLARSSEQVAQREELLHQKVTSALVACLLAPLIGGVLPPLLLWKRGWSRGSVMLLSVVTGSIYAAEFAFLHAWIPSRAF